VREELVCCAEGCVLSCRWWAEWCAYTRYKQRAEQENTAAAADGGTEAASGQAGSCTTVSTPEAPRRIDNRDIVFDSKLRDNLEENRDFVIVSLSIALTLQLRPSPLLPFSSRMHATKGSLSHLRQSQGDLYLSSNLLGHRDLMQTGSSLESSSSNTATASRLCSCVHFTSRLILLEETPPCVTSCVCVCAACLHCSCCR
jgi:hypothetical protein